jgi:5-(carboxyamino)imidazole ribonucleotide synthase
MKIGVLGAGQLGRMMALAGYRLGLDLRFYTDGTHSSAGQVAPCVSAPFDDAARLEQFATGLDVLTYEFENVPVSAARRIAAITPRFLPPPSGLEIAQDRLTQKRFLASIGVPTPTFVPAEVREELDRGLVLTGYPAVLKTRRWGYDGRGQHMLREPADVAWAWEQTAGAPLLLEGFVNFEREVSLVAARGLTGETVFYPLTHNVHQDGILRLSLAPAARCTPSLQQMAEEYARRVLDALHYAGVLTIEFFERGGTLLANEMATRVHNSGHWTIDGAETSQFENHLRAICGFPLGSTSPRGVSAMVNFIGSVPDLPSLLEIPGLHVHLYGKSPRPGRKLGHATLCASSMESLRGPLDRLLELASCFEHVSAVTL